MMTSEEAQRLVAELVAASGFRRATFTGPARRGSNQWTRVVVRPLQLRGEACLQFSYFDGKKTLVRNLAGHEAASAVAELAAAGMARVHVSTDAEEIDIQTTRKGKVVIGRGKPAARGERMTPHNRVKEVPLPEGEANPLLETLGILTRGGQVKPTMRAKYRQINELLKHLGHVLGAAELRDLGRPLQILDCGCGSSYLTFAVHHYLNDRLGIPAAIIGVDVNEELIRKSIERSGSTTGLAFSCARIAAAQTRPDIVLALHACDTATDEALAHAIRCEARLVLSVPCCHHDLNEQIRARAEAEVLRPLLRHGILQQRQADLVTDAFRALILRLMGYRTDVVEFISPEHTSRNLMIRGVRGAAAGPPSLVQEYLALRRFWQVTPFLEGALGEPFQRLLSAAAAT